MQVTVTPTIKLTLALNAIIAATVRCDHMCCGMVSAFLTTLIAGQPQPSGGLALALACGLATESGMPSGSLAVGGLACFLQA